jgi:hypothetical protein
MGRVSLALRIASPYFPLIAGFGKAFAEKDFDAAL